ncbi:carboxypeptidase regulatory-like domain-containing protein [Archangium violaceum]|uniref:carboxypeptidase-like regulatory domain-containing protein n=1 Tax=Archangium violaceum TaxID=83451 RepID=UPI00194F603D|nr:carboxypeptidase-like regulatory domain-containing protein [Archangium violaceum]QRN96441.1 carboxypeptidase regulatory-like domain-containing protein [Archangium violaceum]
MKKHWAVVLPLLVIGCNGPEDADQDGIVDGVREPDTVSVVAPANPKGTVSGQVLTTRMEPLSGVSVGMTIGSATTDKPVTATTDASGNFMFTNVPAGSNVLLTISKPGYATLRTSAIVPSSAGNIPINNGNANIGAVSLTETNSTVRFTLVTPSGRPAAGAQAYLEATPAGIISVNGTATTAVSSVVVMAQADALGVVTFERVPAPAELARIGGTGAAAGGYRLWVDPIDLNTDGIFDAGGYARKIDASTLMAYGGSQLIQLPAPRTDAGDPSNPDQPAGFGILATNVPSLNFATLTDAAKKAEAKRPMRNLLRSGESIFISFTQPVAKDSLLAILTDEYGQEKLDLVVTPSVTGDSYTLTPAASVIREGQEYNLILRATSAYDGTAKTWKGFFISGDPKTPRPAQLVSAAFRDTTVTGNTAGVLDSGECVLLTFNQLVLSSLELLDAVVITGTTTSQIFKVTRAPPPNAGCAGEAATKYPIDITNFNDATSRFFFTYASATTLPPINPSTTSARVKIDFARFQSLDPASYYETSWGAPIPSTTVVEAALTKAP